MARTAVVAGTATAVSNRVSRRQAGRWADQEQQQWEQQQQQQQQMAAQAPPPAAAAPAAEEDPMERLRKLGELHESGVLTDAEFASAKAKILGT